MNKPEKHKARQRSQTVHARKQAASPPSGGVRIEGPPVSAGDKTIQQELFSPQEMSSDTDRSKTLRLSTRKNSSGSVSERTKNRTKSKASKDHITSRRPARRHRKKRSQSKKAKKERLSAVRFFGVLTVLLGVVAAIIIGTHARRVKDTMIPEDFSWMVESDVGASLEFAQYLSSTEKSTAQLLRTWLENPVDDHTLIQIPRGTSVQQICSILKTQGVLGRVSEDALEQYLVREGLDTRIRAGIYLFPDDLSLGAIALVLVKGFSDYAVLPFYDGITIDQIDSYLSGLGIVHEGAFRSAAERIVLMYDGSFAEGYMFPETYVVPVDEHSAEALAAVMFLTCIDRIAPFKDAVEQSGRSLDEVMIVASMIQRETANTDEMAMIAGIIWNRLDAGMPLGIDATTRYETDNWDRPITMDELQADTPYNTRKHIGLPPTGISNPGLDAIHAAVYPEKTRYYYYLHDRSGNIHPAETYAEHLTNIERYLR